MVGFPGRWPVCTPATFIELALVPEGKAIAGVGVIELTIDESMPGRAMFQYPRMLLLIKPFSSGGFHQAVPESMS